jgi:hypothetical protein
LEFINEQHEWNKLLSNDQFKIQNIYFEPDNKTIQVTYSETEALHNGNNKTNVILAGFVTTYGRLALYNALEILGDRVLYFDTDSVYYISKPCCKDLPLGNFLGEFTNELAKEDGDYIEEMSSTGPKSLGWRSNTGVTHCTLKGLTYNYLTSCVLTYDEIKEIVFNNEMQISCPQYKFCRKKHVWEVFTRIENKKFRFTYDKRIILADLTTRPYGFFFEQI